MAVAPQGFTLLGSRVTLGVFLDRVSLDARWDAYCDHLSQADHTPLAARPHSQGPSQSEGSVCSGLCFPAEAGLMTGHLKQVTEVCFVLFWEHSLSFLVSCAHVQYSRSLSSVFGALWVESRQEGGAPGACGSGCGRACWAVPHANGFDLGEQRRSPCSVCPRCLLRTWSGHVAAGPVPAVRESARQRNRRAVTVGPCWLGSHSGALSACCWFCSRDSSGAVISGSQGPRCVPIASPRGLRWFLRPRPVYLRGLERLKKENQGGLPRTFRVRCCSVLQDSSPALVSRRARPGGARVERPSASPAGGGAGLGPETHLKQGQASVQLGDL